MTQLDHRSARSVLVMGLAARASITIDDQRTIATSFPSFVRDMTALGAVFT